MKNKIRFWLHKSIKKIVYTIVLYLIFKIYVIFNFFYFKLILRSGGKMGKIPVFDIMRCPCSL